MWSIPHRPPASSRRCGCRRSAGTARKSGRWPAATYVLWDLRWCWWLALVAAVWRRVDSRLTDGATRRVPAWATVVGLVAIPVMVATAFTPNLRFSGALHGDEPKYLRFAENLVQGVGFDIAAKRRLADLPADFTPRVFDNIGLLVRATAEEAGLLLGDVRRLRGGDLGPPLRAGQPTPDLFFEGKHPGTVYQLHNPGLSFLLFPGYLLDRTITGHGLGYQGEFPAAMPATSAVRCSLLPIGFPPRWAGGAMTPGSFCRHHALARAVRQDGAALTQHGEVVTRRAE